MKVGYIGLGAMGGALARRLLPAHSLAVWDMQPAAVGALEREGAIGMRSASELARCCDVVVLCLPRANDVCQVVFGPDGLLEGLSPGKIVIDQTSSTPAKTRMIAEALARQGIAMLDAPIVGHPLAAASGAAAILVSGLDEVCRQTYPVLRELSRDVLRCGKRLGDAQAMQLVNSTMNAGCHLATLEVVAMGRKKGLPLATMTEALNHGTGRSQVSQLSLPALLHGRPSTRVSLLLMLKNLIQSVRLGQESGVPMPIAGIVRAMLQTGVNILGDGARLDDLVRLVESMASTTLAGPSGSAGHAHDDPVAGLVDSAVTACNQLIALEAVTMGCKYGLTIADMESVVNTSSGASAESERMLPMLGSGTNAAGVTVAQRVEDLRLATRVGMRCGTPMLIANAVLSQYEAGLQALGGSADVDEMASLFEAGANTRFSLARQPSRAAR